MNLLRFFKREKPVEPIGNNPVVARPVIEKAASERFGKTVMPNTARVLEPDGAKHAISERASTSGISLGGSSPSIAFRPTPAPAAERTVALHLAELIPQIPAELLGGVPVDPAHRLTFNAAELERGMANGRPAVLLRSIYQQAPTIFTSEVGAEDKREIPLPFHKVLEQFASLQVRADQEPDAAVPQVETPFLQVTLEDSEKFGISIPAPPAVVPPPPAPAIAPAPVAETPAPVAEVPKKIAAPGLPPVAPASPPNDVAPAPKPAIKLTPLAPIRLAVPDEKPTAAVPSVFAPNEPEQPQAALPVAPKLYPNGAGAPISERVPASSGSSAPIPLPSPLAPAARPAPLRIPFHEIPPALPKLNAEAAPASGAFAEGPRLRLSLRNVLREIPPFQLDGSLESVPEDAKIELPFALVQPQLSLGRVTISPEQFQAAMPAEFRSLYRLDAGGIPVALPLPEILQNLPNDSLQIRDDQEEVQVAQLFETPFSQKAAEDAARLNAPTGPISKSTILAPEPATPVAPQVETPALSLPTPASVPEPEPAVRSELPPTPRTDETPDAKSVVHQLSQLDGIKACAVVFSDGLSLAGNLPDEYEADALCAIAPEIMKRLDQQMSGANLGDLHSLTIYCAKAPVSFFSAGDICLAALHSTADLSPEIRDRLGRATQELARIYARPALA